MSYNTQMMKLVPCTWCWSQCFFIFSIAQREHISWCMDRQMDTARSQPSLGQASSARSIHQRRVHVLGAVVSFELSIYIQGSIFHSSYC